MADEYLDIADEWENEDGDVVWISFNDDGNIEITPLAFEGLLRQAGYEPVA